MNICSLTKKPTDSPVICVPTGLLFDKQAYLDLVAKFGACPITKAKITENDFIEVKPTEAKQAKEDKIGQFISRIDLEHNTLLLENTEMEREIKRIKGEIVNTLTFQEGANKVISKLLEEKKALEKEVKERNIDIDLFKAEELEKINEEEEFEFGGIHKSLAEAIDAKAKKLSSLRKKAKKTAVNKKKVGELKLASTFAIEGRKAGLQALSAAGGILVASADDGRTFFFDDSSMEMVREEKIHSKRVNSVELSDTHGKLLLAQSSNDKTASVVEIGEEVNLLMRIEVHSAEVTGCNLHPVSNYCVSSSLDGFWAMHNYERQLTLSKKSAGSPILSSAIHPDGQLIGGGLLSGTVKLWSASSEKEIASFDCLSSGAKSVAFSENGFHLAVAGGNEIKFIDLRKQKEIKSFSLEENTVLEKVKFDSTGSMFGFSGNTGVGLGIVKSWENLFETNDHKGITSDLLFSGTSLISIGFDKQIHKYE